ncbi:DUF3429 domain-containing protein [Caulobacter sp.]|uniref:DUF3429 domain-containing protein n=1 Tax=Caulobacter sp. TaxID=78 RepID=UPI003BAAB271
MNSPTLEARPGAPTLLSALGALGAAPFWLPVLAGLAWPRWQAVAVDALSVYAAVILSFLAGARMGMTIVQDRPSSLTLCLSMVPPILAWVLVLVPFNTPALRFVLLALALLGHAAWDSRARETPLWYPRLRWPLTLAATAGLLTGAVVLHG